MFNLKGPQGQKPRTTCVRGPQFEKRCPKALHSYESDVEENESSKSGTITINQNYIHEENVGGLIFPKILTVFRFQTFLPAVSLRT